VEISSNICTQVDGLVITSSAIETPPGNPSACRSNSHAVKRVVRTTEIVFYILLRSAVGTRTGIGICALFGFSRFFISAASVASAAASFLAIPARIGISSASSCISRFLLVLCAIYSVDTILIRVTYRPNAVIEY
jgi:hypothetical protein